jgi:hypothetical protein
VTGEIHVGLDTVDFLAVFPLKHDGHWRLVGQSATSLTPPRESSWDDVSRRVIEWMRIDVVKVNCSHLSCTTASPIISAKVGLARRRTSTVRSADRG